MPYIPQPRRFELDFQIDRLQWHLWSIGDVNYVITRLLDDYLGTDPTYETFNAAIGVLECAKLELYRRLVAPYEDKMCLENGDVFRYNEETEPHD